MSKYYTVQITSGNSPGPYTIYYDYMTNPYIAQRYLYPNLATGITISEMLTGVVVQVPDTANTIYLYNVGCNTNKQFILGGAELKSYSLEEIVGSCLCIVINNTMNGQQEKINVCDYGNIINNKPEYSNETVSVYWNENGFWDMDGYEVGMNKFRSIDNDNVPDTNWAAYGPQSSDYQISVQQGNCDDISINNSLLVVEKQMPICMGTNTGLINANAIGGSGDWMYSLDNILYTNNTGLFTSLSDGFYTVYAKDSNNNLLSEKVTLQGPETNHFSVVGSQKVSLLPSVGGMNYYLVTVTYDTSLIPLGKELTFDYNIIYNLNYLSPGVVTFDTTQHTLYKNGEPLSITQIESKELSESSPSTCNPLFSNYDGYDIYNSSNISLINGDILVSYVIYGIDTQTQGTIDGDCYTKGFVNLNLSFENVKVSCDCCTLNGNLINILGTTQIYQV